MLLRGSAQSQERILTVVGIAVVVCTVLVGYTAVANPFARRPAGEMSITIDTPYVGQGVRDGTSIVLHGVPVGRVTGISSLRDGGLRMLVNLHSASVAGLTDSMKLEFLPVNYFGVTGIGLTASPNGQELHDGMRMTTVPKANSTLQALLARLGEVSTAAITPEMISALDRVTRYTDGMTPLIQTILVVMGTVADVQTVSTAQLLANTTGIGVATPVFSKAVLDAGDALVAPRFGALTFDDYDKGVRAVYEAGSIELFGGLGRLESNYVDDLLPAIDGFKALTDTVPALFRPDDFANTLVQLRTRLEKLFAGNGEQRALQVKIVLDSLPGIAAPMAAAGAGQ